MDSSLPALVSQWYSNFLKEDIAEEIFLEIASVTNDTITLRLSETNIKLSLPKEDNEKVSLSCSGDTDDEFVGDVVNSLQKSISNQPPTRDISSILDMLKKFISDALADACDDKDDYSATNEYGSSGINDESTDPEWLTEHNLKRKWIAKEVMIRQNQENGNGASYIDLFAKKKNLNEDQIFSSSASSKVLINDLLLIRKEESSLGYTAEPIEDNIYIWRVLLNRFNPDSDIATDLAMLESTHGYSHVELQMSFAMDLHPFFPPLVTIIQPRFTGSTFGKIAMIESLKLKNWDPVRGTKAVITDIRKELEYHSHIDLNHPLHCIHESSSSTKSSTSTLNSCYTPLEHLLLKLGLVTESSTRLQLKYIRECEEKVQKDILDMNVSIHGLKKSNSNSNKDNTTDGSRNCTTPVQVEVEDRIRDSNCHLGPKGNVITQKRHSSNSSDEENNGRGDNGEEKRRKTSSSSSSSSNNNNNDNTLNDDNRYKNQSTYGIGVGSGDGVSTDDGVGTGGSILEQQLQEDEYNYDEDDDDDYMNNNIYENENSFKIILDGKVNSSITNSNKNTGINTSTNVAAGTTSHTTPLSKSSDVTDESAAVAVAKIQYWAKGTGYGHNANRTVWNVSQYLAAQAEQDRLKRNLLTQVLSELKIAIRSAQNNKHSSNSHSSDHSSGHVSSLDMVYSALEESCLLPLIEEQLRNESLLDMERHRESYCILFQLLHEFALCEELNPLLLSLPAQQEPINSLLGKLGKRLSIYKKQTSKVSMVTTVSGVGITTTTSSSSSSSSNEDMASSVDEDALMRIIQRVLVAVEEVVERQIIPSSNSTSTSHLKSIVDLTDDDVFVEGQYKSVMQGLQYDEAEELYEYHYRRFASTVSNASSKRVKRLAQEHADLSHSLPLSLSSSVWVRCSSSRMDMLQTIISGPDDTPYSNGLFLFDAYFPDNYPSVAPNVNLQTTGSGTVRFNPNLYNCGKVCLSLLGTWEGKDGETWNENTSTFLQVLVSIQSLIFVPDPYFNEPGFEAYMGTPRGVDLSRNYNEEKREETVKWAMIDHFKTRKIGFHTVITNHFRIKKKHILKQVQQWVNEANDSTVRHKSGHCDRLSKLFDELKIHLQRLI